MAYSVMIDILDWEKPDLVVITGDMVTGFAWDGITPNWYANNYDRFTEAMREKGIHWVTTAGNQDS